LARFVLPLVEHQHLLPKIRRRLTVDSATQQVISDEPFDLASGWYLTRPLPEGLRDIDTFFFGEPTEDEGEAGRTPPPRVEAMEPLHAREDRGVTTYQLWEGADNHIRDSVDRRPGHGGLGHGRRGGGLPFVQTFH